ncbi:zinc finger protein on ecdysone puffs-like [Cylas formicarius]|uniref:zinc finger protein on ecdysone puffs-like n=1 Tax=Cylas formicarius TaxID=197179 RepID=UPI002958479E|nr:zinc finger protein on ecdysone puffs-like [Cylas formicarius]XP_060534771.1 zinc finger protein on ecdysone puffs-like [Cylas formicarius]
MVRGRPRGSSYRGNPWGGSRGGPGSYGSSSSGRFSSFERSSDRYPREDYHKPYRPSNYDDSYSSRDNYNRSPERKRPRNEAGGSRSHDSFSYSSSGGRYSDSHGPTSYTERRSYSGDRPTSTPYQSRRDDFRKPSGPIRGSFRGRISTRRGSRGMGMRERGVGGIRRRLAETSYAVRKRPRGYRGIKVSRIRSGILRHRHIDDRDGGSSDDDDDDDEDVEKTKSGDDAGDEDGDGKKETEERDDREKDAGETEKSSKMEVDDDDDDQQPQKSTYIRLVCPRCNIKIPTFRRYEMHLQGKAHVFAMRRVAMKQKTILAQMRQAQRKSQNELEKKGSGEDLTEHTHYCQLCRLNYKQPKEVHLASESHKNMKRFLMPRCKVCSITFKSPMIYESHCCSIQHIKRKQQQEQQQEQQQRQDASEQSGDDDNLEDFTTIDSVGDVDENGSDEDKKKEKKEPVNVGIEKIRKVESHYCDLCRIYLPRARDEDVAQVLSKHCKLRVHMQRYVRYKENQELEKRAEKLQRKETAEKEKKKEGGEGKKDDGSGAKDDADPNKSAEDDKLWEAVDKDLGELLGEADGNKSEDDDDDDSHVNGERYDRFKFEEKKAKAESEKAEKDEAEAEAAKPEEEQ